MTELDQQIAIAKACGWMPCTPAPFFMLNPENGCPECIKDYLHDLNAMHEAEKLLINQFDSKWDIYWRHLEHIKPHPIFATAAQRAEAFLRTLNLWKD